MPDLHWNPALSNGAEARACLEAIIDLAREELPFAAQVGQLALGAQSLEELEGYLASLYRIALEGGHWSLPDQVDGLLRWVEFRITSGEHAMPWTA